MAADGVNDDCTERPSDYAIEKVDKKKEVNEVITDFESAEQVIGPGKFVSAKESFVFQNIKVNYKHMSALIALNVLFTIAEAWNKGDEFKPDFSDCEQDKWFPWFTYDKDAEKFVFSGTHSTPIYPHTSMGSRLCFKSSERAAQFGKQFMHLYNKVFL